MTASALPPNTQREIEFSASLLRIALPGEAIQQADELARLGAAVANVQTIDTH